jgi:nucleotide-binding universal stress UspA family protein
VAVERIHSNGGSVAGAILGFAGRHSGDLIVVGAFSHARASQLNFGGVTRAMLRDATVPLLIAH